MRILKLSSPHNISLNTIYEALKDACQSDGSCCLDGPIVLIADRKNCEVFQLSGTIADLYRILGVYRISGSGR